MKSIHDHELLRSSSAWAPLRKPLFRALWISSLTSSIGTWMHEVGAAWLMTSLTLSPMMVALLHTAASLPMFLLALPAGAIADMLDRRKILLFTQGWMLASAAVLCVVTALGVITPWLLLILTFALGVGAAMNAPAWQSTIPEFVPAANIPAAVALTGLGLNLARAVGPAIGGAIVKGVGAWAVFLLNAASFLGVIVVLFCWRGTSEQKPSPASPVMSNIGEGIQYALHEPGLRAVLVRVSLFVPFASALWALVPLLARHDLALNCSDYGALFGCLGIGSVMGALFLPKLRCHFATDTLVGSATILFAAATAALAEVRHFGLLCLVLMVGGMAWITLMSAFNVATQMAVPSWIRARARALYLLVFHGCMTVGGVFWGVLTEHAGVSASLLGAAAGMVVGVAAIRLCPLPESGMSSTTHRPEPTRESMGLSSVAAGAYGHRSNMG